MKSGDLDSADNMAERIMCDEKGKIVKGTILYSYKLPKYCDVCDMEVNAKVFVTPENRDIMCPMCGRFFYD